MYGDAVLASGCDHVTSASGSGPHDVRPDPVCSRRHCTGEEVIHEREHVKGNTTDFTQTIESMQLDGETVKKAKKGMSVGAKAPDRARRTDLVFKVAD